MKYTIETSNSIKSFENLYEAMEYAKTLDTKDYKVHRGDIEKVAKKYTEAQKRATLKYQKNKVKIQLLVSPTKREEYRGKATAQGKSLQQYIIDCIERG